MTSRFRFESILQLRSRDRDAAAKAVEEVKRAVAMVDGELESIQLQLAELTSLRKQASTGNIAVASLLDFQRHQLVLVGNVQHMQQQRATLRQEQERREARLVKAQQAVKSLEKLRDQQRAEAQLRDATLLQSRLDEWSNTRVASHRGE